MIDMVVPRQEMRDTLARLCGMLTKSRRLVNPPSRPERSKRGMDQHDAILSRLLDLHPKKIDLSLGRIERLLDAMGRPIWPCRRHSRRWNQRQGLDAGLPARRAGGSGARVQYTPRRICCASTSASARRARRRQAGRR